MKESDSPNNGFVAFIFFNKAYFPFQYTKNKIGCNHEDYNP